MDTVGLVETVEVASLANENSLYKFIRAFSCLPTPSRLNTFVKFRLTDASKPPLTTNSLSLLKPSAWADLLGGLRIYLPIILGYVSPPEAFILS